MSYLLDRKTKRKKFLVIIIGIFILLILFYFQTGIFRGLSSASQTIFHPVLVLGNNIGEKFSSIRYLFKYKSSLVTENENLKSQILESQADRANYSSIVDENNKLKEILGRKNEKIEIILAAILSKPNQSVYGTLLIDAGTNLGIKIGNVVFALGNVPIGRIAEVFDDSSKVILFTNPGEKTDVVISSKPAQLDDTSRLGGDVFMQVVGRGGGNFEMILPRDFTLEKGTVVHLPGLTPYILGIIETIISDPRDSFQKALLVSPVNVQELKFVEVEK